jgi:hypothetical protein
MDSDIESNEETQQVSWEVVLERFKPKGVPPESIVHNSIYAPVHDHIYLFNDADELLGSKRNQ